jgi:hypothetical protein
VKSRRRVENEKEGGSRGRRKEEEEGGGMTRSMSDFLNPFLGIQS